MNFNFKNVILKGTIILTAAGIFCRIVGFFFRIYITRLIGAEGMGIYQLITPLAGVIYAACIAGICTAISRFTAENPHSFRWLLGGISLSIPLSFFCTFLFLWKAPWISNRILMNPSCVSSLKMLSLSFPFAAFHSCIGAYFLGIKKVTIPACSQILEQMIRISAIVLISFYLKQNNIPITVTIILAGNLIGDLGSTTYQIVAVYAHKKHLEVKHARSGIAAKKAHSGMTVNPPRSETIYANVKRITQYSLPLTLNRVLMQLLASGEAVLIPLQLMLFGMDQSQSLSVYGVLAGMALPFISFPSAITNSLSVMLLPEISEAQSKKDNKKIATTIRRTIKLCTLLGLFFTLIFILVGAPLSTRLFHNQMVGTFVSILSWICPFQYLAVTLGSILNGLGNTTSTCVVNIAGILIRIAFLILLTPKIGITGYLYGLLAGQIFVCVAHLLQLNHQFQLYSLFGNN